VSAMSTHTSDEPRGEAGVVWDHRSTLRRMTTEQLLHLGTRQIAYLRAGLCDGELLFVLYGADGMPLLTADDAETAVEMASERGLGFVAVH
jgi:hypothetical protein